MDSETFDLDYILGLPQFTLFDIYGNILRYKGVTEMIQLCRFRLALHLIRHIMIREWNRDSYSGGLLSDTEIEEHQQLTLMDIL